MIQVRPSAERGHFHHGWLDTYHTFSFADYFDPAFLGFRSLRVINEDRIAAGTGFGTHSHKDMEIISYIAGGELTHKDSMGNGSTIRPGDVQYMSAGTGVTHSEFNDSKTETHLIQIWIIPDRMGYEPRYDQKAFSEESRRNRLCLVVSGNGRDGSIAIHQDIQLFASTLTEGHSLHYSLDPKRFGWVQVISGHLSISGSDLRPGDGAALSDESNLEIQGRADRTEFLLFDLK